MLITGTKLVGSDLEGADVRFNPYSADAAVVQPDVDTQTSLSRIVPSGAGDGPIRVTTFAAAGGQVFSAAPFLVPPPDCAPAGVPTHARNITLTLKKHLRARGVVSSTEDPAFTECVANVPVKIQRKKSGGGWKNVGSTTTNDTGAYNVRLNKDKPGKYRARANSVSLGDPVTDTCLQAISAKRTHRH